MQKLRRHVPVKIESKSNRNIRLKLLTKCQNEIRISIGIQPLNLECAVIC